MLSWLLVATFGLVTANGSWLVQRVYNDSSCGTSNLVGWSAMQTGKAACLATGPFAVYMTCTTSNDEVSMTVYVCMDTECNMCSAVPSPSYPSQCSPMGVEFGEFACLPSRPAAPLSPVLSFFGAAECAAEPLLVAARLPKCEPTSPEDPLSNYSSWRPNNNELVLETDCPDDTCTNCGATFVMPADDQCHALAANTFMPYPYYKLAGTSSTSSGSSSSSTSTNTSASPATATSGGEKTDAAPEGGYAVVVVAVLCVIVIVGAAIGLGLFVYIRRRRLRQASYEHATTLTLDVDDHEDWEPDRNSPLYDPRTYAPSGSNDHSSDQFVSVDINRPTPNRKVVL
eukprot:TRINITY_DN18377_c0_g1_i1.p1 TRINITY_DN18377_c0_g1~~TRINITY_DN18377_c0_g1_i1.p1  ORF type:complete len:374 (+),score=63.19 TRINITY_DN18377_c0_g1_i1:97-1122(+)